MQHCVIWRNHTPRWSSAWKSGRELSAERAALQSALADLQATSEARAKLAKTVERLATPILPVRAGVLVMPIIGVVDEQRAEQLIQALLDAIQAQHARVAILDVTALTSVDTYVIQALLQTARSTELLGARPILVGVSPAVAEVLVHLDTPLNHLLTMADLQAAVSFAIEQEG